LSNLSGLPIRDHDVLISEGMEISPVSYRPDFLPPDARLEEGIVFLHGRFCRAPHRWICAAQPHGIL